MTDKEKSAASSLNAKLRPMPWFHGVGVGAPDEKGNNRLVVYCLKRPPGWQKPPEEWEGMAVLVRVTGRFTLGGGR